MAAKLGYLPAAMRAISTALRFAAVMVWSIAITLLCLMVGLLLYVIFRPDAGVGTVLVGLVATLAGAVLIIYCTGNYQARQKRPRRQGVTKAALPVVEPVLFVDGENNLMARKAKGLYTPLPELPRRFGG